MKILAKDGIVGDYFGYSLGWNTYGVYVGVVWDDDKVGDGGYICLFMVYVIVCCRICVCVWRIKFSLELSNEDHC